MDLSISRNLFDARLQFFPSIEYSHATVCVCESAGVAGDFKFCSESIDSEFSISPQTKMLWWCYPMGNTTK